MKPEDDLLIPVILGLLFAGVGVHLYLWSRSQSRAIRRFAESRGLVYRDSDEALLEPRLNETVALAEADLSRTFSRVRDVVSLGNGTLFRAVELLDLSPWGRSEYVNKSRVSVLFRFPGGPSGIYLITPEYSVHQRYPDSPGRAGEVKAMLQDARVPRPPCVLSMTIMRGHVLAYLEPTINGLVSRVQLDYLVRLPGNLLDLRR